MSASKPSLLRLLLPLLVLLLLGVFLLKGLWLDPKKLPSALIGKPIPRATLPVLALQGPEARLVKITDVNTLQTIDALKGQPWVLNVFASWCQACLVEHPHWLDIAQRQHIRLVGLAYKDQLEDTRQWLAQHGNPYDLILIDQTGDFGIELGVYGVPETFLMSSNNVVLHKQVGPIEPDYVQTVVGPTLEAVHEPQ
ncbi:MAG TPA: DsbE family thiol:disulfide interchange protein [Limnobacter sp.]|uniref:DsbE family thiol:disulfide interchange protein n=1 Tax=Limnobacter sp. TaxID=2003368 RepID=UPI002ED9A383